MAKHPMVRDIRVTESVTFDRRLAPQTTFVYSFFIAEHGPFTIRVGAGEHTPEVVQRKIDELVRTLRESGAIEPGQV